MDQWLRDNVVCPQHRKALTLDGDHLYCVDGERYRVVEGIPVLLYNDGSPTHGHITKALDQVARLDAGEPIEDVMWYGSRSDDDIDGYVKADLHNTCGHLYFSIQEKLPRYPFPRLRMDDGNGERLLDIGCGWGRWSITSQSHGYNVVGLDPSIESLLAAKRVAAQVGVSPLFVAGDALSLPFKDDCFDIAFSYSILQHLKKVNAKKALEEAARVVHPEGRTLIQMPNKFGARAVYHQVRLGFKEGKEGADVIYWTPSELKSEFERIIGPSDLSVDCYFGLNLQAADADIMPPLNRFYINTSEVLRSLSGTITPMLNLADSLYVSSVNRKGYRRNAASAT